MRCSICPPGPAAANWRGPDATVSPLSATPMTLAEQVGGGQALRVGLERVAAAAFDDRDRDRPGRVERQLGAVPVGVLELGLCALRTSHDVGSTWLDPGATEHAQQVVVLVLEAQDARPAAALHAGQRHPRLARVVPDGVTVWAGPGLSDHLEHARLEPGRDAHLEGLRLLVDVVPGHAHDLHEKRLDQAVAADDVPGDVL